MCIVFGLFYPSHALVTRVFHSKARKIQITMQDFIFVLFLVGLSLGFSISMQFVRSKKISNPPQVLGIMTLILFLAHIPLVFLCRAQGPKDPPQNQAITLITYQTKSEMQVKRFILGHRLLAILLFVVGLISRISFNFALVSSYNKLWVPLALAWLVLWFLGVGFRYIYASNNKDGK